MFSHETGSRGSAVHALAPSKVRGGYAYLGPHAIWPLVNPTVVALPLGILGAVLGSLIAGRNHENEKRFDEVRFRIQTGLKDDEAIRQRDA